VRVLNLIQKPQRRGAETFASDLSNWMRSRSVDAQLLALYAHDGPSPALGPKDVLLDAAEQAPSERFLNPLLLARLIRAIRRFQPDVVQCNGGRTLKYAAAARLAAPRALWIYRNIDSPAFWLKSAKAKALMPPLVRFGFDAAICVSEATLREVQAAYGFIGRSVAIENGVDFTRLGQGSGASAAHSVLAPGRVKLVWVGALGPQKRPDVAIELMALLPQYFSLTMLGEGPWRERVLAMVAERDLGERVRLVGNRADVGDVMRAADMLVMTSDTEGIPAVVIEAQHCGLPVVAFDVGGLKECLPSAGTGRLVRHGDLAALAAAVVDEGARVGGVEIRARCTAFSDRFSIEQIGPRYLRFYTEQLGLRQARR